jgi:hypothetical protein
MSVATYQEPPWGWNTNRIVTAPSGAVSRRRAARQASGSNSNHPQVLQEGQSLAPDLPIHTKMDNSKKRSMAHQPQRKKAATPGAVAPNAAAQASAASHRRTVRRPPAAEGTGRRRRFKSMAQAHAVERLPMAVVRVPVAADWDSVRDFSSDAMNEPRAALPAADVSLASSAVSVAM